ncbi:hypothetical protein DJ564_14975 [Pseudomonas sp. 31-12]|uniref:hypothetical protein n=1 Tax=Pseudomonas sp. 31-12 TaxID=2201356 RepID=UPI000D6BC448|nr:hypothetical protein [Pseudomonas sp. 31-12]AWM92031.1 hypothetical protein DJ564_14975 [Pseudomonas sp. 31-12]
MHGAIRLAGYSLMTMFVSCGVGAQDLDTRVGKMLENSLRAHEAIPWLSAGPLVIDLPSRPANDDATAVERRPRVQ